jgi:hypothetical protein
MNPENEDDRNRESQPDDPSTIEDGSSGYHSDTELEELREAVGVYYSTAGIILMDAYHGLRSSLTMEAPPTEQRQTFFETHFGTMQLVAFLLPEAFAGEVATFLIGENIRHGWLIEGSSELEQELAPGWQKRLADWMCDGSGETLRRLSKMRENRQAMIRDLIEALCGGRYGTRSAAFEIVAQQWEVSAKIMAFFWLKIEQIVRDLSRSEPMGHTDLEPLLADVINRRFTRQLE